MSTHKVDPKISYLNYPEARRGPDVPYKNEKKNNPALRGLTLAGVDRLYSLNDMA